MKQETDKVEVAKRPRVSHRHVIAGGIGLVVIGVIIFLIALASSNRSEQKSALQSARDKATTAMNTGNYEASLKTLQEAESHAQTKQQKLDLNADLSAAAASSGDIPKAIDYLKKRHAIESDTAKQDAYLMGSYYERQGDTAQAITQYQIALDYLKGVETKDGNGDIASLQAQVQALKEQQ